MASPARRRGLCLAAVLAAAAALTALAGLPPEPRHPFLPAQLKLESGGRDLGRLDLNALRTRGRLDAGRLRAAVAGALPASATARVGTATVTYRYQLAATQDRALARARSGGTVEAVRQPVSSQIAAPVVRQALRNNCESAALSILLATTGVRVAQLRLQQLLPRSGPLDPDVDGAEWIWGDPELGFVGRAEGGGTAGGFGVYQRPIAALARRYGRRLQDLTATSPALVYRRLLQGHAVMAWVGLSEGPYRTWRSPGGRRVRVNFGEHTVVLVGITSTGEVRVVNPLQGTRETWSKQKLEAMWLLLGRRALST